MISKVSISRIFSIIFIIIFTLATPALAAPGDTIRVSVATGGAQATASLNGSHHPSISADGRYVAFMSQASNLVSGDTNGVEDVFIRDILTDTTTRVSVGTSSQANNSSFDPSISADGRYVAFYSWANLVGGDTNGTLDVFVRDTQDGITTRVSVDSNGVEANRASYYPSISADGRYVIFESFATNLVRGDTNGEIDVFMHDTQTNTTSCISVDSK
ncbi:hypothetical protein [Candidatus Villigracilis affinis]|uniref:TolB family protein n=1 Tax=Candidatus Villigracilis affinis TaxID=3140682 RepID=UPI001E13F7D1|nr:PD40 domain-containing protein [Anaerolineales bacterium]